MKNFKSAKFLIVGLTLITLTCSCQNSNNNSNKEIASTAINNTQKQNTQTITKSSTEDLSTNPVTNEFNDNEKKFISYLNTNKIDAVKLSNTEDSEDTVAVMESHMTFPCVYIENLGITFIYPTQADDALPIYLSINGVTNKENINIMGAKPGMTFDEIKKNLEGGDVKKTWIASEEDVAYVLEYSINGFKYSFVSYEEDGKSSELYISKKDK